MPLMVGVKAGWYFVIFTSNLFTEIGILRGSLDGRRCDALLLFYLPGTHDFKALKALRHLHPSRFCPQATVANIRKRGFGGGRPRFGSAG